jgi:hypothetical protein
MRGRPTTLVIALTPDEQATLEAWQRSTIIRAGLARRGRMVLLRAAGHSITAIAARIGVNRRFVYKWIKRYQTYGLAGLRDGARGGPRSTV